MKKKVSESKGDYAQTSYILGILSIVFAFFTPLASLILGMVGVILGKKQNTPISKKGIKYSKIGIVISIILIVIAIVIALVFGTNLGIVENFPSN